MKKIIAIVLALTIILSLGTVAFAADSSDTIAADTPTLTSDANETTVDVDHVHTFETFTDGKSHCSVCTVCAFVEAEFSHKLIACERFHQWDCDECGEYRVYHDENTMDIAAKNEFFHIYSCADCGYEYASTHNFATSYNTEFHNEVCVDCGYETAYEAHVMVNDFYGDYHDIQCDYCGYMAEHHVGVKYETVDSTSCQALCRCGVAQAVEHDFYDFTCDNCDYIMSGTTYATVGRISRNDDNSYRVRFIVNGETQRIDMWNVDGFEQGDFVKITHSGNEVIDVTVLVDGDVVDDPENFKEYISPEIMANFSFPENLVFEDIVMEDIIFHEDGVNIIFESGRISLGVTNDYIVYDLRDDGEVYKLCEYDAVLYLSTGEMTYFIVIW